MFSSSHARSATKPSPFPQQQPTRRAPDPSLHHLATTARQSPFPGHVAAHTSHREAHRVRSTRTASSVLCACAASWRRSCRYCAPSGGVDRSCRHCGDSATVWRVDQTARVDMQRRPAGVAMDVEIGRGGEDGSAEALRFTSAVGLLGVFYRFVVTA